jgi:hypothetical protein
MIRKRVRKYNKESIDCIIASKCCSVEYKDSYVAAGKYIFTDAEYGEFTARLSHMIYRNKKHPLRSAKDKKLKAQKFKSAQEINDILISNRRHCRLLAKEIGSMSDKYLFMDSEYGEFLASVESVLNNHDHPKRGRQKAKSTIKERYGVEYYSQHPDHIKKCKDTYNKRYGVDHNMRHKDSALVNARSRNEHETVTHWKTGEECVCIGSYESSVVKYFNYYKIEYIW